jgi:hypothetical protein
MHLQKDVSKIQAHEKIQLKEWKHQVDRVAI